MSVSSLSKLAISIPREAVYAPAAREFLASGVVPLHRLLGGGLPRGKISEITGPSSCGKTSLLMRILAEATRRGEFVAYVDAFDCLDPASACRAGVDPGRMFWLRHRQPEASRRIRSALEAADIVVRCDGFGVVVLDLQPASPTVSSGALGRTSFSVWHRLKRLLRGKSTLLLLLAEAACSGSAASLVLELEQPAVHWRVPAGSDSAPHHARLLWGISANVRPSRGKSHGRCTIHSRL